MNHFMRGRPPIFAGSRGGTPPRQYFHRARMFRDAAMRVRIDYSSGEPYWPKYALLTHALELSLKAFVHDCAPDGLPPGKEPAQHNLNGWYLLALEYGLPEEPDIQENVSLLNDLHEGHYTRYPQNRTVASVDTIADYTVDRLMTEIMQKMYPR
jgi:hypothetical protein